MAIWSQLEAVENIEFRGGSENPFLSAKTALCAGGA
jgi:hypothetical protein